VIKATAGGPEALQLLPLLRADPFVELGAKVSRFHFGTNLVALMKDPGRNDQFLSTDLAGRTWCVIWANWNALSDAIDLLRVCQL
jgi:hypothetical protein